MADELQVRDIITPENLDGVYQRRLKFIDEAHGRATAYDTAITAVGYGAFFALWSGVATDLSRSVRTLSAAMMTVSLLLYIGWTIASMLVRHKHDAEFGALMQRGLPLIEEMNEWDKIEVKSRRSVARFNGWWPFVFGPSVLFGVIGASVLAGGALAAAL